jgi:hypothetical protein
LSQLVIAILNDQVVIWSTPTGSGGYFHQDHSTGFPESAAEAWFWSGKRYNVPKDVT